MCGFGASKCADAVRQNMVSMMRQMCGYGAQKSAENLAVYNAKCRSDGVRQCDGMATVCDREQQQIDKIALYLRTIVFLFFFKPAFQSLALIRTIKTGKCKS